MSEFFSTYLSLLVYVLLGFVLLFIVKIFICYIFFQRTYVYVIDVFKNLLEAPVSRCKYFPAHECSVKGVYKGRSFNVVQSYGKHKDFLQVFVVPNNIPKPINFYKFIKSYPSFDNDYKLFIDDISKVILWAYKYEIDENEAIKILDDGIKACDKVEKGEYNIN